MRVVRRVISMAAAIGNTCPDGCQEDGVLDQTVADAEEGVSRVFSLGGPSFLDVWMINPDRKPGRRLLLPAGGMWRQRKGQAL